MKKRSIFLSLVLAILIGALAIPSYLWTHENISKIDKLYNSRLSPIIMIPGSSASVNRFDTLVGKLNQSSPTQHSLLKVKVWNNGEITYSGKISSGDNEPIIVVGFENNKDGYSNIKKQAKMFNQAFTDIQEKYSFNNFKGIGHSNGGLIYTLFLENYFADHDDIEMKRLMTIGSPYNFDETSIDNKTEMLADFIKNRENLPDNLVVYSVTGTETYDSDGLVPESSVLAGKYIYQDQVQGFTAITVTGQDAQHSDLPQNDEVITLIRENILDKVQEKRRD